MSADYENGALTVTFSAKANVGVYGEIEVYVNGESQYVLLSDCAYDEASASPEVVGKIKNAFEFLMPYYEMVKQVYHSAD